MFLLGSRSDMFKAYHHSGDILLNILSNAYERKTPIEIQALFKRFTLDTFGRIGFGYTIDSLINPIPFSDAFDYLLLESDNYFFNPLRKLFTFSEYKRNVQILDDLVYKIITERRTEGFEGKSDYLTEILKMEASGEVQGITNTFLRDQLINFFIAGRDTTALLLTWTAYFLARNPEVEKKVRSEILSELGSERPTIQNVKNLRYLQMVFDESLRLFPPAVPYNSKVATSDCVLVNGARLHKGQSVVYSPYVVHRDKVYWGKDAEEFRPERWEEPGLIKHPYQFLPFQKGPRMCLGVKMAYEEAKCCLAMIFQRGLKMDLVPNHHVTYKATGALVGTKNGIMMNIKKFII